MIIKVGSVLLAGCTVVLKPSELASLAAFPLVDAFVRAGLPAGVLNLVTGRGIVGEALVSHPGVDAVTFTGTTEVGRHVAQLAASGLKRVVLGLGGKSPSVLLDDADIELAARATVESCFSNSGQACGSLSRMLVPRRLQLEVEAAVARAVLNCEWVLPRMRRRRSDPHFREPAGGRPRAHRVGDPRGRSPAGRRPERSRSGWRSLRGANGAD